MVQHFSPPEPAGHGLRVLTFLHSFEPGGVERIALRLVRRWRELGVDAPLFIGRLDGAMRHDVGAGLDVISPPPPRFGSARWETLWMIRALPRAIREQRPDILFCAGNTYAIVAIAMRLLLGRKCPPILAKISNDLDRSDMPKAGRASYHFWLRMKGKAFDHVVSMDDPMVAEIRDRLGIPLTRITTIPDPALTTALIARLRARPSAPVDRLPGRRFVAVGRLAPQKNIAMMLRAFARGAQEADRLVLIGDGPERPKLEALAARLGLRDRIDFRGYMPDPASLLHEFDTLLLSSNYEGVPAVVLEALAAKLSIIATDCSRSMQALLKGGKLGELVAVGDETMFAQAIARSGKGCQCDHLSLAQAERFTLERAAGLYVATMSQLRRMSVKGKIFAPAN
ncbi:glycosyltransferase [Sphingomonas sp. MMS24-J13]|uniref:glycosyltransferase n=1 Tax=Sphingomonas sp. MMS24-J13 TaxID=3238686 RepID=UPI00384CFEC4